MTTAALLLLGIPSASAGEPPKGLAYFQAEGKIGPYPVGLTLTVRDYRTFETGHYYYASKLLDIPLKGQVNGGAITLEEPGGGVFHLRLVTNASAKGQALNFYNSTGLKGDWSGGGKTLPVSFAFTSGGDYAPRSPRYSDVTSESDAAFENRVRKFLQAAITGDKAAAGDLVSYPLRVNGVRVTIRNKADLAAHWKRIFTPGLITQLKSAIPHEMSVHDGEAMVAHGAVWFDAKGAVAINLGK